MTTNMLTRLRALYENAHRLVTRDIWLLDTMPPPYATGLQGFVLRQLRVLLVVGRGFLFDHQCMTRAAALTYTTLLALVPMLAFMFAFLKGLGVQNTLEPILLDRLPVTSEDVVRQIINYVNNVQVGTLGVLGLGSLLFTTILQFGNVEHALNDIWGVHSGRPLLRKIADYISIMVIGPVVMVLAIGLSTALQHQSLLTTLMEQRVIGDALLLFFQFLRYVALWCAFAFAYAFLPNTSVKLLPAIVGGVLGGTLWQLGLGVYIDVLISTTRFEAIYGAFAQLPILMVWIYLSWVVTLLGAEVSFACQNASTYHLEHLTHSTSFYVKEWLATTLYFSMARDYSAGQGPWSAQAFAREHGVPIRLLREVLNILHHEHLIVEVSTAPEYYVPGRLPDTITPWDIFRALRHHGDRSMEDLLALHDAQATALMARMEEVARETAGARSVTQWLAASEHLTTPSYERSSP